MAPLSVAIKRHQSDLGWWEMASRDPHPLLAGQVLRYAGYVEHTNAPLRRLEPPFQGIVLILSFDERIRLLDAGGRDELHTSFTGGLSDGPTFTEHGGCSTAFRWTSRRPRPGRCSACRCAS